MVILSGTTSNHCPHNNVTVNTTSTAYYKIHPGQNKFYCHGHCIMSRQYGIFYVTILLIISVSALFFAFDCRYLTLRLSSAIPLFGGILCFFVLAVFFRASFMDPGIIPRASRSEVEWAEAEACRVSEGHNSRVFLAQTRDVLIRGFAFKQPFCHTCLIHRPPRASHCSICDNCVERFDHHCPWIGNCVGRRNYRYFIIFIFSVSVYCTYILAFAATTVALVYMEEKNFVTTLRKTPVSLIEICVTFFTMWSVFGLSGFHMSLICREFSTHEHIRGMPISLQYLSQKNPYSRGSGFINAAYILCGPPHPSLLKPWRVVDDDPEQRPPSIRDSLPNLNGSTMPTGDTSMETKTLASQFQQLSQTISPNQASGSWKQKVTTTRAILRGEVEEDGESVPNTSTASRRIIAVYPSSAEHPTLADSQ